MRHLLLVPLTLLPLIALAGGLPERSTAEDLIDVDQELQDLGPMEGVWQGMMVPVHDPVGANRQFPEGYPIQVTLGEETAELAFVEDGGRIEPFPIDAFLAFSGRGTALIEYVAMSQTFTEVWTLSLLQVGQDRIEAFVSRSVHNVNTRRDSPWRAYPVFAEVDLKRVVDSNE